MQQGTKRKYTFKYHMSLSPEMQTYVTGSEPQKVRPLVLLVVKAKFLVP